MKKTFLRHAVTLRVAFVLALLSIGQCTRPQEDHEGDDDAVEVESPPSAPLRHRPPAVLDYGPCESIRGDGEDGALHCVFDHERRFRVWLDDQRVAGIEDVRVSADGHRLAIGAIDAEDIPGFGVEFTLPEGTSMIEVALPSVDEVWRQAARANSCQGCHDGSTEAWDQAASFIERIQTSDLEGDWEQQLGEIDDSLAREGRPELRVQLHTAVAHHLTREHRFEDALELLQRVAPLERSAPRLAAYLDYNRGALNWRWGRSADALRDLRAASLHALRSDERIIGVVSLPMYAEVLAEQGYVDAALKWSQIGLGLVREIGDACDVASTLRTVGWMHLLLRQQGWSHLDPEPMLRESLDSSSSGGTCDRPESTGGARLSLARLALWDGDPHQALRLSSRANREPMTPGERVHALDVEVASRSVLGQSSPLVDRALRRLKDAALEAGTPEASWQLAMRRGQVLERRGQLEHAIVAYREAEDYLDSIARLAGIGVGRSASGTLHRESSERLVDVLRRIDRTTDAQCVARQAEARRIQAVSLLPSLPPEQRKDLHERRNALRIEQARLEALLQAHRDAPTSERATARGRVVEQRRRLRHETDELIGELGRSVGRPACDELHQPEPGELILGLFPHKEGWLLFAHDNEKTTAHALALEELDLMNARPRLSELLLRPVSDHLRQANRVRVHAVGQAQRIDFAMLPMPSPWEREPLITHMPVVYGIDVATSRPVERQGGMKPRKAVLLADPTGSLPDAQDEIVAATWALWWMGWSVDAIARNDTRSYEVQERIAGATLFHYAGHAEHGNRRGSNWWPPYPGGTAGWPASLRLADEDRLAAPEVLTRAGHMPPKVILSGCQTGALDTSSTGMNLAVAFLLAGSDEVIAATDDVPDARARDVIRAVYEELAASDATSRSLAKALAGAQRRFIGSGEPEAHYRVWVR